jgi:hypothetical protein
MGRETVARCLVEQGADKDKAHSTGCTPLFMAAQIGLFSLVQYLVEQGADKDKAALGATPLFIAAQNNHLAVVRYLVEQGADMDRVTHDGRTPLRVALAFGRTEVSAYLIGAGARTLTAVPPPV